MEITEPIEQKQKTDQELFKLLWSKPREAFHYINEQKYEKYMKVLLVLAGISRALDRASLKNMGDDTSLMAILGMSIILGGILGWISYYIYAALISWTGSWLNGKGDTESIFRVMAYALVPMVISLALIAIQIMIYGNEVFKSNGDHTSAGLIPNVFFYAALISEFLLGLWSMILFVIAVAEAQKFSIGKAILNIVLPIFIILVPIGLIVAISML